jgi:cobalt-precorrin 5A hydrolase
MATGPTRIAVWALTPAGAALAKRFQQQWPGMTILQSGRLPIAKGIPAVQTFDRLREAVADNFTAFDGHLFVMAAGIVVRAIAPHLQHKTVDPAVVVMDDGGRFAISLVAGHIGGANRLARQAADLIGATAVITTATDINNKPSIDVLAVERDLCIETPNAIKTVSMALLNEERLYLHDPYGLITDVLAPFGDIVPPCQWAAAPGNGARVYVDDTGAPVCADTLVLRPRSLCVGIGCNRNTGKAEIQELLRRTLEDHRLSANSLRNLASIDLKRDEPGLLELAGMLGLPIRFYTRDDLNHVNHAVPNPSAMVAKHVGVKSVCEAAAILAARQGPLIVPKQKTPNVTVAIARHSSLSSESAPAA